jgi:hypothetical protein
VVFIEWFEGSQEKKKKIEVHFAWGKGMAAEYTMKNAGEKARPFLHSTNRVLETSVFLNGGSGGCR